MNKTYPGLYFNSKTISVLTEEEKAKFKPSYPDGWNPTEISSKTGMGLLYRSLFDTKPRDTFVHDGIEMEFVDYWPNSNSIRACYTEVTGSDYQLHTAIIHISKVDLASLKTMELWSCLDEATKQKLETNGFVGLTTKTQDIVDKPHKGRQRDPEHANLPRALTCSSVGCDGKSGYMSPKILIKLATAKGVTPQDYAKSWRCSECEPRIKGKKTSEKWASLPKELTCSNPECAKKQKQHPSITQKLAEAKGLTFDEYVKSWVCRDCKKIGKGTTTTTTTTRGRKISPDSPWFGKAKELICACGKKQKQHPSQTTTQAEKLGKTFDEYVATWQCRDCRPAGSKRIRISNKVANPAFAGIPKDIACTQCKKVVKLVPQNIIEKAQIMGISVEDLLFIYKCGSCGGRLPRGSKKQHALA